MVPSGLGSRLGLAGLDWTGLDPGSAALCCGGGTRRRVQNCDSFFLHRQAARENESVKSRKVQVNAAAA